MLKSTAIPVGKLVLAALATVGVQLVAPTGMRADDQSQAAILERLQHLEENQAKLYKLLNNKDQRIQELEAEVGRSPDKATSAPEAAPAGAAESEQPAPSLATSDIDTTAPATAPAPKEEKNYFGTYKPGAGIGIANGEWGAVNFGSYTYLRYLNTKGLNDNYTNGVGQRAKVDHRDDLELNKVKLEFRGWMFDPRFRYVLYSWTNNAVQGQGAQVVLGGNLNYAYTDSILVGGGILSLPTTRSTQGNFPNWLTVDHRTIADEFFRGSYTMGVYSYGSLLEKTGYFLMLGNNLSILGVDAGQLDGDFTTVSTALWWMPTTGEFGPKQGFGDYEMHENLATRLGVHFTFSPEDRQSQPGADDIDNSQIRLSNGTVVFTDGAIAPGVGVKNVNYYMTDFDAGMKYRGFALEGEYYLRWLNNFNSTGPLPVDSFFDHGFQIMGSMMVLPKSVQAYSMAAWIFGEYGNAWETTAGLNYWPFQRKEVRLNIEYIYDHDSPIGYTAVPQAVGGTGSIVDVNLELSF